ncbi:MAG TPA: hypothetical protein VLH08_13750, partial [Acidobacteriota bacterium]|nr:hypothetical protein [Acidobacteriota bacterium]
MKLFRRIAIAAGILIALLLLAVVIIHMPSVQMAIWSKIQNYLQSEYNVHVEAERLQFSLLSGVQAELSKVKVYGGPQNEQQFAIADKVRIYAPLSILWSSDKIVEKVQIENPDVNMDYAARPKPQPEEEDSGKF